MLDDVQRRTLLIDPAGKDPVPIVIGTLHIDLDEGSGQLFPFPRRRRFAGAQADDDVLQADRLAGFQGEVADDAVALVQEAEHRDPLGHRRDARLIGGRARHFDGDGIAFGRRLVAAAAAGKHGQPGQGQRGPAHYWSGVQAL
jgi:hypothetical protein